jgi:DNA-directed RNA polymerase subunit RPC12/RpoP
MGEIGFYHLGVAKSPAQPLFFFFKRHTWLKETTKLEQKIVNCPHCGKILSEEVWKARSPEKQEVIACPECGSQRYFKDGMRQTGIGKIQRYLCRDCCYRFS